MLKKQSKTKEEKAIEDYSRITKEDLKFATEKKTNSEKILFKEDLLKKAVEKKVLPKPSRETILFNTTEKKVFKPKLEEIEIVEKAGKNCPIKKTPTKKRKTRKKTKKVSKTKKIFSKKISYKIPNVTLKKNGYVLIITEKPQAATKIATSLGEATQRYNNKVSYYELERKKQKIIVACAVGHLFTLSQNSSGTLVPTFDISWYPNYLVNKKDFTKRYYDTLLMLAKGAKEIIVATDFDVEGEVIGWNVVRFICNQRNAKRMKFSTLTKKELEQAYDNVLEELDWPQAYAGETRHFMDWYYGINLSRALMNAIKTTGQFKIMSIGRVQGPALNLIVKREKEIQNFKPETYFQISIEIEKQGNKILLQHPKKIFNKQELEKFQNLKGQICDVNTNSKQEQVPPNPPFNLTTLQTEAYKFYGITPSRTLQIAQSLYLSGLISYPRTSSQKLPESIGYKEILKTLAKQFNVSHLTVKEKPLEGKKEDPAHPSIYPTGNSQILSGQDKQIYELIVKRFLSLFCEDAIIERKKIKAITKKDSIEFSKTGSTIKKEAWLSIYPSKSIYELIPDINEEKEILNSTIEEKETMPPKRYSPASILSLLEKKELGTKATRSAILETLYQRGYVKDTSIQATALGISLINTLEKYSPIIIDEKLTRQFEKEMEKIREIKDKKYSKKEEEILAKAKKTIIKISDDLNNNLGRIGGELLQANLDLREQEKIENTLMKCPECRTGELRITYSPKTKRNFVGCSNYPECKNTYSLPPVENGTIKKTGKLCEECSFTTLIRTQKARKPWIFCFNPNCPTNAKWAQKREEENKV